MFEEDTTKNDVEYEYKMELEYQFEEKIHDWLDKINQYTDEKQCQSRTERDFYKFILPKFADPDGDP